MISIKEVAYKNYGKCLAISNDIMEVLVTVDIGPRIIKCNLCGKENMMFEDIERNVSEDVSELFGADKKWYIYGGHRIWMSPESFPVTYYPDNDKVVYRTFQNGAEFTPSVQADSVIQITLKVEMAENEPKLKLTHKITNTKKEPITGSLWCLSVMAPGGTALVAQPTEDTGLLANRSLIIWPYTRMTDKRLNITDKYITVSQDKNADTKLKIGFNNTFGKAAYINKEQALVKYSEYVKGASYPDNGCSVEIFTNNLFEEVETLSPLTTLARGEAIVHTEDWTIFPDVTVEDKTEEALEALAAKLF